ncbi:hypothetical protein VNO80_07121 [Phaseolus coccineus]|uniref:Defensin-like protein n=1 Tax=Phaseolus coccineus TaxID=3886 RepID=A0AAN9NJI9_PHACN
MASGFYHVFLLSVLMVALVVTAEPDPEPAPDDGISTDSISVANCIDSCFPGCRDACLGKGFKDGFCFPKGLLHECCCQ